jgi:regulator of sigma E protease
VEANSDSASFWWISTFVCDHRRFLHFWSRLMQFLAFIPILTLVMLIHEFGHFVAARLAGIVVEEFGIGLPPRVFSRRIGGVRVSLNAVPLGAFVRMNEKEGEAGSFLAKKAWVRFVVLAAGPTMNFVLGVLAFAFAFQLSIPRFAPSESPIVDRVIPGTPAAEAGLEPGDELVSVDAHTVSTETPLTALITGHQPVTLRILRHGEALSITTTPRENPPDGEGPLGVFLSYPNIHRDLSIGTSLVLGWQMAVKDAAATLEAPVLVARGVLPVETARPVGLPGMAQITAQAVDYSLGTGLAYPIFVLIGAFSTGMAVMNFLPIPALDGGRIALLVVGLVRGRQLSRRRETLIHLVGLAFLMALMIAISLSDLVLPTPIVRWS